MFLRSLILLTLSGCLPIGLPEYFANSNTDASTAYKGAGSVEWIFPSSRRKPVALVVKPNADLLPKNRNYIGYQFLLGVIPFTRMYFQHGAENLGFELLLDRLTAEGFLPATVSQDDLLTVSDAVCPRITLRAELSDLSVNGYDAFFFRVLNASGRLRFELLDSSGADGVRVVRRKEAELSGRRYGLYAHGPELAAIAREAIGSATDSALREILPPGGLYQKSLSRQKRDSRIVFTLLPQMKVELSDQFKTELASSYGFGTRWEVGKRAAPRIIQRGLKAAWLGLGVPSAVVFGGEDPYNRATDGVFWSFATTVTRMEIVSSKDEDRLRLGARFILKDLRDSNIIARSVCEVEEPVASDEDGFWVVTMERAAERALTAFFTGVSSETTVCHPIE